MSASFDSLDLPADTQILENQIAGHKQDNGKICMGMLKHTEGFVMKPVQNDVRGQTEIEFYKSIFLSPSANPAISKLQQLIPKFLGIHSFSTNTAVHYFIKMEDVANGIRKPCIADIKIGKQTWDPFASTQKRMSENKKYSGTKSSLGFCIPGMSLYEVLSKERQKFDKVYGRNLNSGSVKDALRMYLNASNRKLERQLVSDFLRELHSIRLWFEEQRLFLFFATSLLLVYDADLLGEETNNFSVRVRMIDFAHVYPAHGMKDSNYLEGLNNLIQIFESFYSDSANC